MTIDQQIDVAVALQLGHGDGPKAATLVLCAVLAARIGAPVRQSARPVGMKRAECPNRQWVPHHRPNQAIATILSVTQSVAMLDSRAPARELTNPWTDVIGNSDIVTENITAPAVMVPGYPEDFEPAVAQLGERSQGAKAGTRDDCLPFKPEVEEIAIDDERASAPAKVSQKPHETALSVARRHADVRIGNEIAG